MISWANFPNDPFSLKHPPALISCLPPFMPTRDEQKMLCVLMCIQFVSSFLSLSLIVIVMISITSESKINNQIFFHLFLKFMTAYLMHVFISNSWTVLAISALSCSDASSGNVKGMMTTSPVFGHFLLTSVVTSPI